MNWRRWICALTGHHPALVMSDNAIWLRCAHCGFESDGWRLL